MSISPDNARILTALRQSLHHVVADLDFLHGSWTNAVLDPSRQYHTSLPPSALPHWALTTPGLHITRITSHLHRMTTLSFLMHVRQTHHPLLLSLLGIVTPIRSLLRLRAGRANSARRAHLARKIRSAFQQAIRMASEYGVADDGQVRLLLEMAETVGVQAAAASRAGEVGGVRVAVARFVDEVEEWFGGELGEMRDEIWALAKECWGMLEGWRDVEAVDEVVVGELNEALRRAEEAEAERMEG